MDSSQEQLDCRLHHNPELDREILHQQQRIIQSVNPYASSFKTCAQRAREASDTRTIVRIRQMDPNPAQRSTFNLPTSREVAVVMIMQPEIEGDAMQPLERDILIETKTGQLQRIPYWMPCFMALRYPFTFVFGECSWHQRIPLDGRPTLPGDHFLAQRQVHAVTLGSSTTSITAKDGYR